MIEKSTYVTQRPPEGKSFMRSSATRCALGLGVLIGLVTAYSVGPYLLKSPSEPTAAFRAPTVQDFYAEQGFELTAVGIENGLQRYAAKHPYRETKVIYVAPDPSKFIVAESDLLPVPDGVLGKADGPAALQALGMPEKGSAVFAGAEGGLRAFYIGRWRDDTYSDLYYFTRDGSHLVKGKMMSTSGFDVGDMQRYRAVGNM